MKFYIESMNGSGMKFNSKEDFLKEISLMIDDCEKNGGTYLSFQADSDASWFDSSDDDDDEEDEDDCYD